MSSNKASKQNVVSNEVRKFGETVSIRGIPKILKTKDVVLKVIWLVSVLASATILVWQLTLLFLKYVSFPVSTTYGEDVRGSIIFPDISICSLYPLTFSKNEPFSYNDYYNSVADRIYNDSSIDLDSVEDIFEGLTAYQIYIANLQKTGSSSLPCPNFISDCVLFNHNWGNFRNCSDFITKYWDANYYTCFTMHLDDEFAKSTLGASFVIYFENDYTNLIPYSPDLTVSKSKGIRASVHPRGTKPDFKRGVNAGAGTETTIKITPTRRSRLSKPYSAYDCTNQKFLPNSTTDLYNYDACNEVCYQKFTIDEINCLSIDLRFSTDQIHNYNICGNQSCVKLADDKLDCKNEGIYDLIKSSLMDYSEAKIYCDQICLQPCKEIIYDTTSVVSSWPHPAYSLDIYKKYVEPCKENNTVERFSVYADAQKHYSDDSQDEYNQDEYAIKKIQNQKEIESSFLELNFVIEKSKPFFLVDNPVYTWDSMIGLVGGCLSLWLGITVMTGVEVIEFIYFMSTLCCRKKKKVPTATLR